MRRPAERLRDILEAIARIERHTRRGRAAFEKDELIQSWVVRHLELIGEAARGLPEEIRARTPGVPWKQLMGMRDVLIHRYFDIDTEIVWRVVEDHLPVLRAEVEAALRKLGNRS